LHYDKRTHVSPKITFMAQPNLTSTASAISVKTNYQAEAACTDFDIDHVVRNIKLPLNVDDTPQILGWAGPARSGTTGLLFLFASQPKINQAFFQPLKTILRNGGPAFEISAKHKLICFKEVFRGCCKPHGHDPIGALLKAGVPPHKITWITILRDPVQNYASWTTHLWRSHAPENYRDAQLYAIELFNKYRALGVNVVPFAYELLELGEDKVIRALLKRAKLTHLLSDLRLDFDLEAIGKKMAYGQAADGRYFDQDISPTLARQKFVYSKNNIKLSEPETKRIIELCQGTYNRFYKLSRKELGL